MRQPGLGKVEWVEEDRAKSKKAAKMALSKEEKETKSKKKK